MHYSPDSPGEKASNKDRRIPSVSAIFALLAAIILGRLFYLQIFQHDEYIKKANAQQSKKFTIEARRGQVYVKENDNELYPIAINQRSYLLAVDPALVQDVDNYVAKLQSYIAPEKLDDVKKAMSNKDNRYLVINKKISDDDSVKIKELGLAGLIISPQSIRNYPEGELFSHITGYVNSDGVGQYGVEQYMNESLAGNNGARRAVTDSLGVPITSSENTLVEPKDGSDLVLTLDRTVQSIASRALEDAIKRNRAESGSVIVMDPKSGAIRAMVNYPDYDPNNYQSIDSGDYNKFINRSVTNLFEPGSGFKIITMAAGLDTSSVKSDTTYNDTGEAKVEDRVIKNASDKKYGTSTMVDVIQKSLNTGMVFVLKQLGTDPSRITVKSKEVLNSYIQKFGFGKKTGIELAGESEGYVKETKESDVDYANMTFGQGITVTSLQLVNAVSAIANGGTLYKPYIVDKEITPKGEIKQAKPTVVRDNVVSSQTAANVAYMMSQVVQKGSGWPTRMPGYNIAGKTGTAQVPKKDGSGYEENKNIGSFVGFAPVEDPKFVMLVRIDYPKVDGFAEKTAVPTFAEIAKELFIYYKVPPSGN